MWQSTQGECPSCRAAAFVCESAASSWQPRQRSEKASSSPRSKRCGLWQVMHEGSRITAIGIGFGLLLALGAGRLLQGLLHGVDAVEPVVLIAAPIVLFMASLLASFLPALRATRIDPTVALRSE